MRKASRNNSVLLILLIISLFLNVFLFAKLIAKNKGSSNKSSIKNYVGLWECVEWNTHYLEIKKDGSVFLIDYRKDESQKQFIIKAYAGKIKDTTIVFDGEYANPKKTQNGHAFDDNFVDHFPSVEYASFIRGNAVGIITRTGADSIKLAVDGFNFAGEYNYSFTRCDSLNLDRITTLHTVKQMTAAESILSDTVVYWTPFGKVYHTHEDCEALNQSDTFASGMIGQAIASNHTRLCSLCATRDGITGIVTDED